jgi:hypothetical protein
MDNYQRTEGWAACDRIKELVSKGLPVPFSELYLVTTFKNSDGELARAEWKKYLEDNDYEMSILHLQYAKKESKI